MQKNSRKIDNFYIEVISEDNETMFSTALYEKGAVNKEFCV